MSPSLYRAVTHIVPVIDTVTVPSLHHAVHHHRPTITDSLCSHLSSVQSPCCHCRSQRRFDVKGVAGAAATLAAGDRHTVVLNEGRVFMFGSNEHGQLGFGHVGRVVGVPRMLEVMLANDCTCGRCENEGGGW